MPRSPSGVGKKKHSWRSSYASVKGIERTSFGSVMSFDALEGEAGGRGEGGTATNEEASAGGMSPEEQVRPLRETLLRNASCAFTI